MRSSARTTSGGLHGRVDLARWFLAAGLCVGYLATSTQSHAQAYSVLLPPQQNDVAEETLNWTLRKFEKQPFMNEIYYRSAPETPAFFRDSLLQLVARSYEFRKTNFNQSVNQAFTLGGWVAFRSGLIGDIFGVHVALYTSQPISAPDGEGGTRLLTQEQNPLNVVGQAYARAQIFDQEIRGGRMLVDTPLINPSDNRMVPNTFEGAQIVTLPDKDRVYDYAAGYLWTIKPRDSNDFIPMSDALASADVINRGAPFAMVKWRPLPGLSTIFMDYYVEDFVNTGFAQAEYNFRLPKDIPNWILGVNYIDQRSVGSNLLTGAPFETYQASGKVQMSYVGWTLFVAGSVTGDGSKIYSPFGVKPNYTDMQQFSFDNPREKAFGGSIAYDLGGVGLPGFSAGAWYTKGWDAFDGVTNTPIADRAELDLWIQYRPSEGPLKGLRVKTQYSKGWQNNNVQETQPEFRFIVDYTILFRPLINIVNSKG